MIDQSFFSSYEPRICSDQSLFRLELILLGPTPIGTRVRAYFGQIRAYFYPEFVQIRAYSVSVQIRAYFGKIGASVRPTLISV